METKISPAISPSSSAPEKKKGNKKKIVIWIAVLIALLTVGGIIFIIFSKLKNGDIKLGNPKVVNVKFPDIIPGSTVKESIPAKTGGQISLTNAKGVKITVDIPPNSLKDDTTVTLDPADPNNSDPSNPNPNNPGSNNSDPNNPGGNPGPNNPPHNPPTPPPFGGVVMGPPNLTFNLPATITFYYPKGYTIIPGTEIAVFVGRDGTSSVLPTTFTEDGSFSVPVLVGGAIIPGSSSGDNGNGNDNSGSGSGSGTAGGGGSVGDPANNAAIASGGKCTPEFLEAIKGKKNFAEGQPGHAAYDKALRDCLDVEKIKEQCANNPIVLRRRHFETRINIANSLDKEVAKELKNLLASCVAKYDITSQGSYTESSVTTDANFNASVCGYIDDEWKATYSYSLSAGAGSGNNCAGTGTLRLPFGGGKIISGISCQVRAYVLGHPITLPGGMTVSGTFIEPSRVILNLFGEYIVKDTSITLKQKTCIDNVEIPPFEGGGTNNNGNNLDLVPLPNADEIPLVPITKH